MSKKVYIYGLFDPRNNALRYIGKTIKPKTRLWEHIYLSKERITDKDNWIADLIEAGLSPRFEVLERTDEEGWPEAEKMWISKSLAEGCDLLNVSEGGPNPPDWTGRKQSSEHISKRVETRKAKGNYILSEEAKKKMSEARRGKNTKADNPFYGKKHSKTSRKKMSESSKGQVPWNKGVSCPDEIRKKISETKKMQGLCHTEEWKKQMSEKMKGRKMSLEFSEKLRQANLGKKHSKETKERIRQVRLGKHHSDETKEKLRDIFKGRIISEETRQKLSASLIGKKMTDEQRQKRSEVQARMWQDPTYRAKMLEAQRRRRAREREEKAIDISGHI